MTEPANENSSNAPPDWQMPAGVDRALWDYLHSPTLASGYDAGLAGSSLFRLDVDFVRRHCSPPGRLLDLGCGTGRLLRELAPVGYHCTGVDLSAEMLRVARLKCGPEVAFHQANLTDLTAFGTASFDHAACLFSTLGMIRGQAHREQALREARRVLRPGGTFVLHVHNLWWRLYDAPGRSWLLGDRFGWRERDLEPGDHRMPTHAGVAGLVLHLFTRGEIVGLVQRAGFTIRTVQPVSLAEDGSIPGAWWAAAYRAYGFLIAAGVPE